MMHAGSNTNVSNISVANTNTTPNTNINLNTKLNIVTCYYNIVTLVVLLKLARKLKLTLIREHHYHY